MSIIFSLSVESWLWGLFCRLKYISKEVYHPTFSLVGSCSSTYWSLALTYFSYLFVFLVFSIFIRGSFNNSTKTASQHQAEQNLKSLCSGWTCAIMMTCSASKRQGLQVRRSCEDLSWHRSLRWEKRLVVSSVKINA